VAKRFPDALLLWLLRRKRTTGCRSVSDMDAWSLDFGSNRSHYPRVPRSRLNICFWPSGCRLPGDCVACGSYCGVSGVGVSIPTISAVLAIILGFRRRLPYGVFFVALPPGRRCDQVNGRRRCLPWVNLTGEQVQVASFGFLGSAWADCRCVARHLGLHLAMRCQPLASLGLSFGFEARGFSASKPLSGSQPNSVRRILGLRWGCGVWLWCKARVRCHANPPFFPW
jgi:hypothetical protein